MMSRIMVIMNAQHLDGEGKNSGSTGGDTNNGGGGGIDDGGITGFNNFAGLVSLLIAFTALEIEY